MSRFKPKELAAIYRNGLLEDTMPFWLDHCVDHQHGGFMMALNRTGKVVDTDKGVWQQGRFTWLLGELYNNVEARDEWLKLARHGAEFLLQHCFDPSDGRMWFHVTRDGKPIRKRRYAFAESFAAIAFGELAKATGEQRYADHAIKTFQKFVDHNLDPVDTPAKFTAHRPTRSIGFPMITIATAQELRESIGFSDANRWIDKSIEVIQRFHLKPELNCVMETVSQSGDVIDHFDGRTLNPGHAIEGAWFLMWEGAHRNDSKLIEMGCQMLDWMWQRGWDSEYGGILYFTDVHGQPVQEYWHDMKFWWPQCEAIIATLLAFQLTGRQKYADWHQQIHHWAYKHFPDSEHGEWFGYLDRTGRVTSTLKGNLWKGPFHLPRMQHICTTILSL
ncbi:AGE family epimerase/isomerase [bacterium]|nr:AGE family epimerase/isomerase [Rubripirellula sp.]MDA7864803.1 AGE family epimerase/isomerase [bacterium]MDB4477154.1 AGE family epimerase/isomerase [Rhodopirellula sp.]MDA7936738.1 AGE family epimerase/isomerase [bacterium]MDB4533080.1 AGE family epimerase/isomerase [bacterium]MDB4644515.1 AGE family epimerase/isomerase [Rubripirellula sp.]